jgi:ribosome recycling factor
MLDALITDLNRRMEGALTSFHNELKGLRTGRANPALLENILIDAYGSKMPLNQVATVSAPEARLLSVQVWDRGMAPSVEKAITNSGLGLNPSTDGSLVRVPMPHLSEERRKELAKVAHQYAEKARVAIRNVRRDGMDSLKKLEKDKQISEDEVHTRSDEVQKLTDGFIKQIEVAVATKEKDIIEG